MTQDKANLISIIADIREKSGVGAKPMLGDLADAIALALSQAYERGQVDMRERAAGHIDRQAEAFLNRASGLEYDALEKHTADVLYFNSAAIRSLPIEQEGGE